MNPLISIIMPVYGVENYIKKAIESVLNQTYNNWQLIIVNDGTKDRSRDIAKQYESQDSRIIVVDKKNGGLSDARNFGLKYVQGEFLHFYDSDDFIEPDFYGNLLTMMCDSDYDYVITGFTIDLYNREGILFSSQKNELECMPYSKTYCNLHIYEIRKYLDFAWNKFYRSSFILKNKLLFNTNLFLIEDAEFMNRVFNCSLNFCFVSGSGYHYCQYNRTSLSNMFSEQTLEFCEKRLYILEDTLEILGIEKNLLYLLIGDSSFQQYKHIYHTLFNSVIKNKSIIVKNSFGYKKLYQSLKTYVPNSIYDKILWWAITKKLVILIVLLYQCKKIVREI